MVYGAVSANWLNIRPMPERWLSSLASYLPEAHNNLVEEFLSLEPKPDRLLILEDDLAVQPSIIARCRTHQADVVSGLYFARRPPYQPLIYEALDDQGNTLMIQPDRLAQLLEREGEHPITACGTGILSIRREVLEAVPSPWFEPSPAQLRGGKFGGHDLYFCSKVLKAGFSLAFDCSELMRGFHVGWQQFDAPDYFRSIQEQMSRAGAAV